MKLILPLLFAWVAFFSMAITHGDEYNKTMKVDVPLTSGIVEEKRVLFNQNKKADEYNLKINGAYHPVVLETYTSAVIGKTSSLVTQDDVVANPSTATQFAILFCLLVIATIIKAIHSMEN